MVNKIGIKLVIILVTLVFGCNSKPKGLLSEKEMAGIIAEQKILESQIDQFYVRKIDSTRFAYNYLEKKIFAKFKTDSLNYTKSYDYYLSNKEIMLDILEQAEKILENDKALKTKTAGKDNPQNLKDKTLQTPE